MYGLSPGYPHGTSPKESPQTNSSRQRVDLWHLDLVWLRRREQYSNNSDASSPAIAKDKYKLKSTCLARSPVTFHSSFNYQLNDLNFTVLNLSVTLRYSTCLIIHFVRPMGK